MKVDLPQDVGQRMRALGALVSSGNFGATDVEVISTALELLERSYDGKEGGDSPSARRGPTQRHCRGLLARRLACGPRRLARGTHGFRAASAAHGWEPRALAPRLGASSSI